MAPAPAELAGPAAGALTPGDRGLALAPVVLMGVVALAASVGSRFLIAGVPPVADPRVVAKSVAVPVAHALFGYSIGLSVSPIVAVSSNRTPRGSRPVSCSWAPQPRPTQSDGLGGEAET